jgi:spermidine synthase
MDSNIFNFNRIGIVGLGVGTLAIYGKTGQVIDFFELDPDVFYIANKYFTYLKKNPAKINYIFGDARVSLSKLPENRYNLLIIDAFSGDSVPIHLLTTEAISGYRNHLTKDGVVLFHVSNRYLNLVPVLFSNAKALSAYASVKANSGSPKRELCASVWVALTWSADSLKSLTSKLKWDKKYSRQPVKYHRPWTDLYSNILSVFKMRRFLDSVKGFQPFYW